MKINNDSFRSPKSMKDPSVRKRRIKFGGNKKQNYTEGWVEFKDKRIAKRVALTLNGNTVGGKKRNYHHDDIWNIKYLSKFKWTHITEKIGIHARHVCPLCLVPSIR